jgi:hypothetical protein
MLRFPKWFLPMKFSNHNSELISYSFSAYFRSVSSPAFLYAALVRSPGKPNYNAGEISGSHDGEYENIFWDVAPCSHQLMMEAFAPLKRRPISTRLHQKIVIFIQCLCLNKTELQ